MNEIQFVYWLQGFFELTDSKHLSENQIKMIKEHLKLVFVKVTPEFKQPQPMLSCSLSLQDDLSKALDRLLKPSFPGTAGLICEHGVRYC